MEEQITPNLTKLFTKTMYQNIMKELLSFLRKELNRRKEVLCIVPKVIRSTLFCIDTMPQKDGTKQLQPFHYLRFIARPLEMQSIYKDFAASPRWQGEGSELQKKQTA